MKYTLTFLLTIVFCLQTFAQDQKIVLKKNEITIPLNTELKITVKVDNDLLTDFKLISQKSIITKIDLISILEGIEKKDIISNEIEFKFSEADFMGSGIIVLTTLQHLNKPIIFKAKIKIKGTAAYTETSIVPKHPNVFSIEQWRDDIEYIFLYDFKIQKE